MDPAKFVVNALAPAIISKVIIDQSNRNMEVIVPDDQLSLAIGKRGQNVRLASKLTNWRIDVKSEGRYNRQKQAGYQSLLRLTGLTEEMADRLYDAGVTSVTEFAEASLTDLEDLTHISPSTLAIMVEEAGRLIAEEKAAAAGSAEESSDASPTPTQDEVREELNSEEQAPEEHLAGDEIGA
jgi:N utilization substance protein A